MEPVWVLLKEDEWSSGQVVFREEDSVVVLVNHKEYTVDSSQIRKQNSTGLETIADLVHLPHLHEPAILFTLQQRYREDSIYTYNGPILLAINPFKKLTCYGEDKIVSFVGRKSDEPHVYGVAERAYQQLMVKEQSQTILASGESGSGKTMTTRFLMNYLSYVSSKQSKSSSGIENLVLDSNPILEAFGNAKTLRNDNSSRFGKFIRLNFSNRGEMQNGRILTYLLEKVRVVKQSEGERNFHIFYQMLLGASDFQKITWKLRDMKEYRIIWDTKETTVNRQDGVKDKEEYQLTRQAMVNFGFAPAELDSIFKTLSGVLCLGNVTFMETDSICKAIRSEFFADACELLGVDADELERCLTTKQIKAGLETITSHLNKTQCDETRDTVVQLIYQRIFDTVVARINQSIMGDNYQDRSLFIGILDIFGFEVFDHNSLEQLHINYTNETLQQLFNKFVFQLEQEEYIKEGIKWNPVDFPDNSDRVERLHSRRDSVFSITNDNSLAPQSSDQKIYRNLKKELKEDSLIDFPSKLIPDNGFRFLHYAGWVAYTTNGFVAKNSLFFHKEIEQIVESVSPIEMVPMLKSSGRITSTATSQFKKQLDSLMSLIESTTPHYVRCIKPNDANVPAEYNLPRVLAQLRYSGVLEAVKVSRAGFPIRFGYRDFNDRYKCLFGCRNFAVDEVRSLDVEIEPMEYQTGKTKLFMKRGPYDQLEDLRSEKLVECATRIASTYRMYVRREAFVELKRCTVLVQSVIRRWLAIQEKIRRLQDRGSRKLSWYFKMVVCRMRYRRYVRAVTSIQRKLKWSLMVKEMDRRIVDKRATTIQSWYRMLMKQKVYTKDRDAAIYIQKWYVGKLNIRKAQEWRERMMNARILNERIAELEEELKRVTKMRDEMMDFDRALREKDMIIEKKEEMIEEKEEVNQALSGKMQKLLIENDLLKNQIATRPDSVPHPPRKRSIWQRLFG